MLMSSASKSRTEWEIKTIRGLLKMIKHMLMEKNYINDDIYIPNEWDIFKSLNFT